MNINVRKSVAHQRPASREADMKPPGHRFPSTDCKSVASSILLKLKWGVHNTRAGSCCVCTAVLEIDRNNRAVIPWSKERLLYLIMMEAVKFLSQTLPLLFLGSPNHFNLLRCCLARFADEVKKNRCYKSWRKNSHSQGGGGAVVTYYSSIRHPWISKYSQD